MAKSIPSTPMYSMSNGKKEVIDNGDGNPFPLTYIGDAIGPVGIEFSAEDYLSGDFAMKYPDTKICSLCARRIRPPYLSH